MFIKILNLEHDAMRTGHGARLFSKMANSSFLRQKKNFKIVIVTRILKFSSLILLV